MVVRPEQVAACEGRSCEEGGGDGVAVGGD